MRADTLVIVNPAAGGGRALRAQTDVADYFARHGVRAEFVRSKSTEDFRKVAGAAADAGYHSIIALGGDGAFHHLVEAMMGREVVLGFLPAGNGNDIARALGIPQDPIAAAQAFLTARPRRVDVIRASFAGGGSTIYAGAGGVGLDAEAAELANSRFRRLPGVTRYLAGALWALAHFKPLEAEVEMETELGTARWSGKILLAAVANAPCYGSGFRIAPAAAMDDGWLDVVLVREISWTRLFEAIPILLRTGDLRWEEILRYRARRIRLHTNRRALVHGDGEILGETPVEFEVLPGAIRVAVPARSSDTRTGE
jgi:diacylglycerol kinase (ATP)